MHGLLGSGHGNAAEAILYSELGHGAVFVTFGKSLFLGMMMGMGIAGSDAAMAASPAASSGDAAPAAPSSVQGLIMRGGAALDLQSGYSESAPPSDTAKARAFDRIAAYVKALRERDFSAAYAMLRLSYQAANPKIHWEMNLRNRGELWANGNVQILRSSWTRDPVGQPAGSYVAFDFLGYRPNGDMDCGYVVVHQPFDNSDFSIVRAEANYVAAEFMDQGVPVPEVRAELPCFTGNVFAGKL